MNCKILSLLIFSSVLVACQQGDDVSDADPDDTVLVLVDGEPVTLSMLELVMENRGVGEEEHDRMQELLDELIRMRAVANAAIDENLDDRASVRAERQLRDMQVLYRHYINEVQREHPVTDADIEEVYRSQHERAGDTQYLIETITYPEQAEALRIVAALDEGDRTYQEVEQAAEEAGLAIEQPGWIDLSQVPPEFGAALEGSTPGKVVSLPLETPQGWRLVRVVQTRDLDVPELEDVREGIARSLLQRRRQALIEGVFEQAEIEPMLPLEEKEQ